MILLFQNVPTYMRSADTQWVYGRYGAHDPDGPEPEKRFFGVRGTLAGCIEDVREVLEREMEADPK